MCVCELGLTCLSVCTHALVCVCVCVIRVICSVSLFQTTASPSLRQSSALVQNAWGNLKEAGLRAYVTSTHTDDRVVNLAHLEASSSSLSKKLVELFEQLFFTPKVGHRQVN